MNKKIALVLLITGLFIDFESFAQGCSQCKLLAEQGSEVGEASFGTNINKGILFLMVIPYILLFLFFRKKLARLVFKVKK